MFSGVKGAVSRAWLAMAGVVAIAIVMVLVGASGARATPAPTSTNLRASPVPGRVGQPVTYTATVTPAPDGGTVAFTDAGSPISGCAAQPVAADGTATCQVTYPSVSPTGVYSVSATYSGDSDYQGSVGSFNEPVDRILTTNVLTASPNPAIAGEVVTYTAKVSPPPNGGTVTFGYLESDAFNWISSCGGPIVSADGTATCQVIYSGAGSYTVEASYFEETMYQPSNSPLVTETVEAPSSANGPAPVSAPVSCVGSSACTVAETLTTTVTMRNGVVVSATAARARLVHRTVVVGTRTLRVAGGRTSTVSVALNSTGRSIVRRLGALPIVLTVKSKQRGRRAVITRRRLTIVAPPRHKKH